MSPRPKAKPTPTPVDLGPWLAAQRWFRSDPPAAGEDPIDPESPAPGLPGVTPIASIELPTRPALSVEIIGVGDARYQLVTPAKDPEGRPDAAADPAVGEALARFVASGGHTEPGAGDVHAHWIDGAAAPGRSPARPLGAEQSNTSLVIGGTHALKVLRRLQAGPHPEVEVGRHLAAVARPGERLPVAALTGWWELELDGERSVLGVVQELVTGAVGAWSLVLSGLASDPGALLAGIHRMGADVGRLHAALARPTPDVDASGPARFGTVPLPVPEIDELADRIAAEAEAGPASRTTATSVRERARAIVRRLGPDLGPAVRTHGDLHLGQVVLGADGWVVLDFEGEPNRSLDERRRPTSPLRDVAGMVRSFAYAAGTHRRTGGSQSIGGWEQGARAAFLDGYLATVDPALLPSSAADTVGLLHLFELEKVVYELAYEAGHRPDWLPIPEEGLARLLEVDP